jgi:hypothetical protein
MRVCQDRQAPPSGICVPKERRPPGSRRRNPLRSTDPGGLGFMTVPRGSASGPPYADPPPIWSPGNRAFGLRLESACELNSPGRRVVRGCEASGSKELRRRFSLRHHFMPRNAIRHDPSGTAAAGAAFVEATSLAQIVRHGF